MNEIELIERLSEIANRDTAVSVMVRADDLRALLALATQQPQGVPEDAQRLMFVFCADAFVNVYKDRYDYAVECAEEAGRDEPNAEDELNGVRRLIDAAMAAAPSPERQG